MYGNAPPEGGAVTFRHRHDDLQTLAVWLHQAGYRTALFGKYLNGYRGGYVPPGWDTFTTSARYWGGPGYVQGVAKHYPFTTYMPNFMGTRTAQFIRSVPRSKPLFAYYAPYAPHAHPSAEPRYASLHVCWHCHGWPTPDFNERGVNDKPLFDQRPPLSRPQITAVHRFRTEQVRTLKSVDVKVGRIVAALRDTGRLHNTIIVFMSDNGVMWGSHRWSPTAKRNPYRRSSRMPLIIRDDALGDEPRIEPRLVGNVDIAPTLAALAGVPAPSSVEGTSFAPILRDPSHPWSRTLLLENFTRHEVPGRVPSYCGVRTDRFLFVHYGTRGRGALRRAARPVRAPQHRRKAACRRDAGAPPADHQPSVPAAPAGLHVLAALRPYSHRSRSTHSSQRGRRAAHVERPCSIRSR